MNRIVTATLAAVAIGAFSLQMSTPAEARCVGCAVGAGIIGGIAAGAIIAGAANAAPPPPPAYVAPAYGPPPPPGPECYYTRHRVWDSYYQVWRRGPRELVCP